MTDSAHGLSSRTGAALASAADHLGDVEALDRPARLFRQVGGLLPRRLVGILRGAPLGHAAHPLIVTIPIGAWSSAAVLDLAPGRDAATRTLVGLGVLSAAPSAWTGLADWLGLGRRARRIGVAHAAGNSTALVLAAASWAARGAGRRSAGRLLLLGALGAVSVAGYLGGHLTYRTGSRVEVDTRR